MASKLSTTDQSFPIDIDLSQLKFDVCLKIHRFIEHRIKIVTSSDTTFKPGETKFIPTNLTNSKRIELKRFKKHLKSAGKIAIKFLSEREGEIKIKERLYVKILNNNNFTVKIFQNTPIAYLFLHPKVSN